MPSAIKTMVARMVKSGSTGFKNKAKSMGNTRKRNTVNRRNLVFLSTLFTFISAMEIPITSIESSVQAFP